MPLSVVLLHCGSGSQRPISSTPLLTGSAFSPLSASLAMLQQPQCRCLPTTGRLPRAGLCVTPSDRKRSRAGRCKRRASGGATTSSASVFATWCVHHTCRSLSCAHVLTLVPFGPLPRRSLPGAGEQVAGHQRPCHRPRRRTHRSCRAPPACRHYLHRHRPYHHCHRRAVLIVVPPSSPPLSASSSSVQPPPALQPALPSPPPPDVRGRTRRGRPRPDPSALPVTVGAPAPGACAGAIAASAVRSSSPRRPPAYQQERQQWWQQQYM